jgi:hypothetical protein
VKVEADAVADASCLDAPIGAVRPEAYEDGVSISVELADVAGCADLRVEPPVWPKGHELPAVMLVGWEVEGLGQVGRLAWIVELVLDPLPARHLVDRGDRQRAVAECEAVRLPQSLGDRANFALPTLLAHSVNPAYGARADEHGTAVAQDHHPCAGHSVCPELDTETLGHLDLIERDAVRRRYGEAGRMRRERRTGHLGRAALHGGFGGGSRCGCPGSGRWAGQERRPGGACWAKHKGGAASAVTSASAKRLANMDDSRAVGLLRRTSKGDQRICAGASEMATGEPMAEGH